MSSEAQVLLERRTWARGKLTVAFLKLAKAIEDPRLTVSWLRILEQDLRWAKAIAQEWGLIPEAVLAELMQPPAPTETKAR